MLAFLRRTRVRLTIAYSAVFLLVAASASLAFWLTFSHSQYSSIDSTLASEAQTLMSGLDVSGAHAGFGGSSGGDQQAQTPDGSAINAVLVDSGGHVLDSIGPSTVQGVPSSVIADAARTGHSSTSTISDRGFPRRVVVQGVDLGNGTAGAIVVSRSVSELQDTLVRLAIFLVAVVVALTLVVSVLGYRLAGRALRPVRVIAATAREISDHDLHRRITLDLPPDELGELAATFNSMLARLEASFEALRRFTADAAHELRAPLTLLRAEMEVSLQRTRSIDEYQVSQRIALAEIERLSRLAEQLLLLARADAGALAPTFATVDMADLVEEVAERWQPLAAGKRVTVVAAVSHEGSISADADLLRRLLDNLLDNAVRYTPGGGSVTLGLNADAETVRVTVADTGSGIDPSLRATVFERFTRADPARGRDDGGAGLGLALCAAIVTLHGGTIEFAKTVARGATVLIQLPRTHASVRAQPATPALDVHTRHQVVRRT